jgi:hypothetical protein
VSPDRWVPPVSDDLCPHTLPLSLPLPDGADLSASFPSRASAHSLSVLRACLVSATNPSPSRSLSHAMHWASPVNSVFPTTDADPRPQVRHGDHPRCLPTRTCSLLNPAHTRSLSPTSFRTRSPYLMLCPRRSRSPEIHDHAAGRPAGQKSRQATPSSIPS